MIWPHLYTSPNDRCVINIDGKSYDCTSWRHSHPGGAELIDKFNNADATDVFYAFHSKKALDQLQRMRSAPAPPKSQEEITIKFQQFRKQMVEEGYFDRIWWKDFCYNLAPMFACAILGTYLARSNPIIATLLLGVAWQQAGWLGHDYHHGRGDASQLLGYALGGCVNGFSSRWWNHKHNTHHAFPNRKEVDSDIHNEPILHLWFPDQSKDVWFRKYQHYYYQFVYAFLYVAWRMQSIQFALSSKNWVERGLIALNYAFLLSLPWKVALGSVLLGGWLVAIVVTANHQTEDILENDAPYNFVRDQLNTTRGVHCSDPITEFLFGGMQYQVEHHLFPFMPRYNFPAVRVRVNKFCEENGLQHHISGVADIMKMNYDVIKQRALGPAVVPRRQ